MFGLLMVSFDPIEKGEARLWICVRTHACDNRIVKESFRIENVMGVFLPYSDIQVIRKAGICHEEFIAGFGFFPHQLVEGAIGMQFIL